MFKTLTMAALAGAFALGAATQAQSAELPPYTVQDEITKTECGDCHMVFPPNRLTKAGWKKIMTSLSDHFGEDASLNAKTAAHIDAYLQSTAMDAVDRVPVRMKLEQWKKKGIIDPIRITETPNWTRHHEGRKYRLMTEELKYDRGSNCIICHKNAERGMYEEFPGRYGIQ